MTLSASGTLSFSDINTELGYSSTATISLNDAAVRTLFSVASGVITVANGYGKSNTYSFNITGTTNANLRTLALAAGWGGSAAVIATIPISKIVYSTSTATPALTINGAFPAGVTLINNGTIVGMGGAGGTGASTIGAAPGGAGGTGLAVSVPVTVTNTNGVISGGGGGGGGTITKTNPNFSGPGPGKQGNPSYYLGYTQPGVGGGGGRSGSTNSTAGSPGGSAGTYAAGGAGGADPIGAYGGAGATWGSTGGTGGYSPWLGKPVTAGSPTTVGTAGAGGAAVTGSTTYITWPATGTRNGPVT